MKLLGNLSIGSLRLILSAAGSTLLNGLVSYWPLNEISGVRYDAVGGNDLTDNNTVGAVLRGPEGTVAKFVAANAEVLTSPTIEAQPAAITMSMWVRNDPTTPDGYQTFCIHGNYLSFGAYVVSGRYADAWVTDYNGVGYFSAGTNWGGINADGAGWIMLTGVSTATALTFYINGRTYPGWSVATTAPAMWVQYGGGGGLGRTVGSSFGSQYFNGQMARHGIWGRELSAGEIEALYDSGNGLGYADLSDSMKVGMFNWYELDEVSGVRYDSHGSNDLTDNNTVGSVNFGPKGVVSNFVAANSEYLSVAAPAPLARDQARSVAFWYKPDTPAGGPRGVFSVADTSTSGNPHIIISQQFGVDLLWLYVGGGYGAAVSTVDDQWQLVIYTFDGAADHQLSINGGTPAVRTVADSTNAPTNMFVGSGYNGQANGAVAGMALYSRVLTAGERAALFNSGRGKRYADLTTAEKVGLVSYWNLDEQSGVRYDSHGSNDLTDNNTVGSVINAGAAMDGAAASFVAANSESLRNPSVTLPASYTVGVWYKSNSMPDGFASPISLISAWASQVQLFTYFSGGYMTFGVSEDGAGLVSATNTQLGSRDLGGEWRLVLLSYDSETRILTQYLNALAGVSTPPLAGPRYAGPSPLTVGWAGFFGYFNGQVDEPLIYDRVLTADERAELFALGRGKYHPFT